MNARHTARPRLLKGRSALCLLLGGWLLLALQSGWTQTLELREARFLLSDAQQPPADDAAWQPQPLPDIWTQSRNGIGGVGWYRFDFDWSGDEPLTQAIYLPRLCMNVAVYLNGVLIGDGGRFDEPLARNWNRPLLFLLPRDALRSGHNRLHLRLHTLGYSQNSLYPPFIGPERELRPDYERLHFLRITFNQSMTLLITATGLLMLGLWWRRRQDTMYGYFGLSALLWALNSTNLYLVKVPLASRDWEILIHSVFPLFTALLLISLLRLLDLRPRRLEQGLWLTLLLPILTLPLAFTDGLPQLLVIWQSAPLPATGAMTLLLTRVAWQRRTPESLLLALALWLTISLGLHDWLLHNRWLVWSRSILWVRPGDLHLLHYGAPLLFLVVGWIMTSRFVDVLNRFEQLNRDLELRVASKHAALEANFARIEELNREQAMLAERQRIVADLHDGLGGQLVTALRLVESKRIDATGMAELLRECLDEMRMVMNSITPQEHDLDGVLATLRHRFASRLEQAGIELFWQLDSTLPDRLLSARQALQMQRIVQECFTNILKHAGASQVHVHSSEVDGVRQLCIADNGRGMAPQADGTGHGIANMRRRMATLGGSIDIDSSAAGTRILLRLPPVGKGWRTLPEQP
ncbi:MAG TPA: hypothetical protein PKN67_07435 [Pseudomonadales bacterium]|nr:hypothetical protein [Pseudomonadales bacterium]